MECRQRKREWGALLIVTKGVVCCSNGRLAYSLVDALWTASFRTGKLRWVSIYSLSNFSRLLLCTSCCSPCLFVLIRCYERTTWYTRECETTKMREWEETEVMQWCCQADCKNYRWRLWLAALKVDHWVATRSREQGVKKAKTYITGANGPWLQFMREQCRGLTISL